MRIKIFLLLSLFIYSNGCFKMVYPEKTNKNSSIIAMYPEVLDLIRSEKKIVSIYFVRIDEKQDLFSQSNIIESNYNDVWHGMFLFNASPGKYAVVAARAVEKESTDIILFPKELIELTVVDVKQSTFNYIGFYTAYSELGFKSIKSCDKAQQFYYDQLNLVKSKILNFLTDTSYLCSEYKLSKSVGKKDERKFVKYYLKRFSKTEWEPYFSRRLFELEGN